MKLHDVERQFTELETRYQRGELTSKAYDDALAQVMAQDETGRWWTKQRGSGAWCYYNGSDWVTGNPFPAQAAQPSPIVQQPALAHASSGGTVVAQETRSGFGGLAYVFYLLALIPIIGLVLWLGFRNSDVPANRSMASTIGVISLISAALGVWMNLS
ncbi:MAG: hypothetical protein DCC58_08150 [Chloroflexi bacterium]|nr:MAG: hypothetical protein DCC58_08150 [Chloroflexota bacterium]